MNIHEYIAQKIIEDIRLNNGFDEEFILEIDKPPWIEEIRKKIKSSDFEKITKLVHSSNKKIMSFGINLLKEIRDTEPVKRLLFNIWDTSQDYHVRSKLTYRLTDYADLDISMHENIYAFIKHNWDTWIAEVTRYFGGADNVLKEVVETRIKNGKPPESKLWLRLCQCMAASNKKEVERIITEYENSEQPLVKKVSNDLKQKLEDEIIEFKAEKATEDIRHAHDIDEEDIIELAQYPIVNHIRRKVREQDIELIIKNFVESGNDNLVKFGISILREQRNNNNVKAFFFKLWNQNGDYTKKFKAMFRLLDYPDLDITIHESMYDFVKRDWDRFLQGIIEHFGGTEEIQEKIIGRINNKDFPETKLWVRLCQCMAIPDKDQAEIIIDQYADSTAPLVSKVVKDLKQKLKNSKINA